jgi:aminopeptidase N
MSARDALTPAPTVPVVIRRSDYRPPSHRIGDVRLDFTLGLESTRVINEFSFVRSGTDSRLRLHGDELGFVGVSVDGRALDATEFDVSPQHLEIFDLPASGVLRIETLINPTANTALMGLYASRGGLFTQCESEGFRRMTYFLDRPDVMATYQVVLRGAKEDFPVMLSNGNLVLEKDLDNGLHEAHWHDPFPKPSYLFALVAAKLDRLEETITTSSGKKALLQVYTRKEDLSQAGFAMQSLKRAIFWDEKRYGLELDLERFMIVAVPDFNSGAMENKGLNLFNTKFVLADPQLATDVDYDGIESVVAHEYFHNWTGNRITCRDWFQLTLKEGLTVFRDSEFSSDMAAEGLSPKEAASARSVRRIDSVRVLRAAQFPEDAGPMSHPIRPDSYQEIRNFYTATVYEKGAEVIRMLQTLLGVDGFRRGMDLYFERHDGQAVTCDEFVAAMFDANPQTAKALSTDGQSAASLFMRWYDTSGTPQLRVSDTWDEQSGVYELTFQQSISKTSPSQLPVMIPITLGLLDAAGNEISLEKAQVFDAANAVQGAESEVTASGLTKTATLRGSCFVLMGQTASLRVLSPTGRPTPSLLRDFSAPVALTFPYPDAQLLHLLAHDADPFNRWEAGQRLMLGVMLKSATNMMSDTLAAFKSIAADGSLDNAYKAAMLTLPSEQYIAEQVDVIDPQAIRNARNALRLALAKHLKTELHTIDAALRTPSDSTYSPDPMSTGRRSLANLAQHWLAVSGELSPKELLARYQSVTNMTDRMAILQALVEVGGPESEQALELYLAQFKDHALALDKWFTVQVTMTSDSALDVVHRLLAHPQFDATNPNRIRSVVGAFFHQNLAGFHRADGKGYTLWADQVIAIDRKNSQLASRMARALDRWSRFEPVRKSAMKQALERVTADEKLSPDVREVVSKALA